MAHNLSPGAAPQVVNVMTIDVEDYFHVSAFDGIVSRDSWDRLESRVSTNTGRLLDIFAEQDVRATFFVLAWVAERYPSLVRQIAAAGHEVASHGYGHRLVYELPPHAFREDVRRAKAVLQDITGTAVVGYRAPSFSITKRSMWALDILLEEGYSYDSSIFPIRHDRYGIPDSPRHQYVFERQAGPLTEVPVSTTRVGPLNLPVGGGGYFRLLPYRWTHWGISQLNQHEMKPAVFYLHPWEIDPSQPRLTVGRIRGIRHYRNLHKTEGRLRRLLRDFSFGPMSHLLKHTPASTTPLWALS